MRRSILAAAVLAVAALAGCSPAPASVTVSVGEQCQPINQYDTRCEIMASKTAAPPSPTGITLTRPAHITYEISPGPSGDRATLVSWLAGPNPQTDVRKIPATPPTCRSRSRSTPRPERSRTCVGATRTMRPAACWSTART